MFEPDNQEFVQLYAGCCINVLKDILKDILKDVSLYVENLGTMTRRKTEENHIRNLTKVSGGSSYAVTIPMEYIRKLKWRGKQKLEVKLYQDRIIIRDWKSG